MRILERNKRNVYYCKRQNKSINVVIDNQGNVVQDGEGQNIENITNVNVNEIYETDNYREIFSKPQLKKVSFLPLAVNGEILETGLDYSKRISIYTTKKFAETVHNGDRFFVFKKPPKDYDRTCSTADYYVHGEPSVYLTEATIYLRRMTGDSYE